MEGPERRVVGVELRRVDVLVVEEAEVRRLDDEVLVRDPEGPADLRVPGLVEPREPPEEVDLVREPVPDLRGREVVPREHLERRGDHEPGGLRQPFEQREDARADVAPQRPGARRCRARERVEVVRLGVGEPQRARDRQHAAAPVDFDRAPLIRRRVLTQDHGGERALLPVKPHEQRQVQFQQRVSVQHEEGLLPEKRFRLLEAAAGAEDHGLRRIAQAHPEPRAVPEMIRDDFRQKMQIHDELHDPIPAKQIDMMLQQRSSAYRHHHLRQGHQGQAAADHHRSGRHCPRVPDPEGQARDGARRPGGPEG